MDGLFSRIRAVVEDATTGFFAFEISFIGLSSVGVVGTLTGWLPKSFHDLFESFRNNLKMNGTDYAMYSILFYRTKF